jgi:hypothetical protein
MKLLSHFHALMLIGIFMIPTFSAFAQAPEGFNYQAVARDNAGSLLKNKNLTVKTIILSGPSASQKVYEETHSVTTNEYGHFNIVVGKGSSAQNFSSITWGTAIHHLKVEIDEGTGFAVIGTVQLQSVPYALHSKTAENVSNLSISTDDLTDMSSTGALTGSVLKWNGAKWVPGVDIGGSYSAGTGININGSLLEAKNNDALWNAAKIQGFPVDNQTPSLGNILKWDGSKWGLAPEPKYLAGMGLTLTGNTFSADNTSAIWNANQLRGIDISTGTPTVNQILQYDGTKWAFGSGASGGSNWTKNGNNIYFLKNVGINVINPISKFQVQDTTYHSNNGIYFMHDNRYYGGTGTGAQYVGIRSIVVGRNGLSHVGVLAGAIGTTSNGGEGIGLYAISDASTTTYNTGVFTFTGSAATSQSIGTYSEARANSTYNVGVFTVANKSNSNTNYGVFSVGDSSNTSYAGYFVGDVNYTGSLTGPSDAKLKYDINNLQNATAIIKQLQPKTYFFKQDGEASFLNLPNKLQYGFIAQDIEAVLPDLVRQNVQMKGYHKEGSVEYKGLDYISLIPVLTQAVKEQQQVIEELQKQIADLQIQIKQK